MIELLRKHGKNIVLIGDMLFSLLVFPFSFTYLDEWGERFTGNVGGDMLPWLCAMYAAMAASHVFRAFRLRERSRSAFIAHLAYGAGFWICAALPAVLGLTRAVTLVITLLFTACLITERALSIARRPKAWNIALNALAILALAAIAYALSSLQDYTLPLMAISAVFYAFLSVMIVIFSRVKLEVLREIIRKTYAAEIISGLLLLMVVFSYMLRFFDDAFTTFWDSLWYCFAVVTTIGFGDLSPTGTFGRVISVVLGIYGIVVVALITSIIVNFYGEMKRADAVEPDRKPLE